jgi:multicomponent Na+:H+ antiporter subunit E
MPNGNGGVSKHGFNLFITLFIVWLLWSGHYSVLLIIFGAISCLIVLAITIKMKIADPEGQPMHLMGGAFFYWPWILWEIFKANIGVTRIILNPKLPISPNLIQVKASQKTALGKVIYANSITLTPGTVSVDVTDDTITVHALSHGHAEELLTGEMDRRVTKMEGES